MANIAISFTHENMCKSPFNNIWSIHTHNTRAAESLISPPANLFNITHISRWKGGMYSIHLHKGWSHSFCGRYNPEGENSLSNHANMTIIPGLSVTYSTHFYKYIHSYICLLHAEHRSKIHPFLRMYIVYYITIHIKAQ